MLQNDEGFNNVISTIATIVTTYGDIKAFTEISYDLYKLLKLGKAEYKIAQLSKELPINVNQAYENLRKAKKANKPKQEIEILENNLNGLVKNESKEVGKTINSIETLEDYSAILDFYEKERSTLKKINTLYNDVRLVRTDNGFQFTNTQKFKNWQAECKKEWTKLTNEKKYDKIDIAYFYLNYINNKYHIYWV